MYVFVNMIIYLYDDEVKEVVVDEFCSVLFLYISRLLIGFVSMLLMFFLRLSRLKIIGFVIILFVIVVFMCV